MKKRLLSHDKTLNIALLYLHIRKVERKKKSDGANLSEHQWSLKPAYPPTLTEIHRFLEEDKNCHLIRNTYCNEICNIHRVPQSNFEDLLRKVNRQKENTNTIVKIRQAVLLTTFVSVLNNSYLLTYEQ